ncbi:hypothetical protein CLAIMM_13640 [Cladophialophora immunda]|nr:hypothetical protein CLAIMM_13640 [Cladophialophora immunda]
MLSGIANFAYYDSVDAVLATFGDTCEAFIQELDDKERAEILRFTSAEDMLQSINQLSETHFLHRSRFTACAKRIRRFSDKFGPYFEVINIFVQTNPEYSGLVWGILRLVFQLGTHYVTFLEKISLTFEQISVQLPIYEHGVKSLKSLKDEHDKRLDRRLLVSLSWIYSDVMEYCFEAYRLLSRGKSFREKARLIWKLSWQPFDDRFGHVLKRLRWHKDLFNQEVRVAQMELGATQLRQMRNQRDQLDRLYASFEKEMIEAQRIRATQERKWESEQESLKSQVIQRLKDWINAPNWEESHESASSRRHAGSTTWFFSEPVLSSWRSGINESWELNQKAECNILLVQGKPGFGKTHLCSSFIDRLRSGSFEHPENPLTDSTISGIFYYYFDALKPWTQGASGAFRAILTQALHNYRNDNDALDAACLMMYHGVSGQRIASEDEIVTLLHWYLRRYRNVVLAFDGLDEADDLKHFFKCLQLCLSEFDLTNLDTRLSFDSFTTPNVTSTTNDPGPAVILFSRPSIVVPKSLLERTRLLSLRKDQNQIDIAAFIYSTLEQLVANGMIDEDQQTEELAEKAASHAGGMFLWARLLDSYLNTDGLTVQERLDALGDLVYLEGLDNLYNAIFRRLQTNLPSQVRTRVRKAFQWIYGARRPLFVDELSEAVNLPADSTAHIAQIPKFREAIPRISGSLLEVTADDTVSFIHSSLSEYLQHSLQRDSTTEENHVRLIQPLQTATHLAASCVSYLAKYIPPEPLSGSTNTTADLKIQTQRFPLLPYILQNWTFHVISAMKYGSSKGNAAVDLEPEQVLGLTQLLNEIHSFILDKRAVMTWIEASWLFGAPPQLDGMAVFSRKNVSVRRCSTGADSQSLGNFFQDISNFSRDLKRLNTDWGHVLSKTSNEIWEPSIRSLCRSQFWLGTEEATLDSLEASAKHQGHRISLGSRVSSNGLEVGLVSLIAPSFSWEAGCEDCLKFHLGQIELGKAKGNLPPWKLCFEVWDLTSKVTKFKVYSTISCHDSESEFHHCLSGHYLPTTNLKVTFGISGDLRKVQVMSDLIIIRSLDPSFQDENGWGCTYDCAVLGRPRILDNPTSVHSMSIWGIVFSDDGRYLLFAPKYSALRVFAFSNPEEKPQPVAKTSPTGLLFACSVLGYIACFHPFLPALALARENETVIWNFTSVSGQGYVKVSSTVLVKLRFSNCGNYIMGYDHYQRSQRLDFVNCHDAINTLFPSRRLKRTQQRPRPHKRFLFRARDTFHSMKPGTPVIMQPAFSPWIP